MEVTQSINGDYKLINFNVPKYLIKNFDNMVKFKRVTRTSLLIGMMESYLRHEYRKIKEDDELNNLIVDIEKRNVKTVKEEVTKSQSDGWTFNNRDDYYEPPMIPTINDDDDNGWMRDRGW